MNKATEIRLGRIKRQKHNKMAGDAIVAGFRAMLELLGAGLVIVIMWVLLVMLFSL